MDASTASDASYHTVVGDPMTPMMITPRSGVRTETPFMTPFNAYGSGRTSYTKSVTSTPYLHGRTSNIDSSRRQNQPREERLESVIDDLDNNLSAAVAEVVKNRKAREARLSDITARHHLLRSARANSPHRSRLSGIQAQLASSPVFSPTSKPGSLLAHDVVADPLSSRGHVTSNIRPFTLKNTSESGVYSETAPSSLRHSSALSCTSASFPDHSISQPWVSTPISFVTSPRPFESSGRYIRPHVADTVVFISVKARVLNLLA